MATKKKISKAHWLVKVGGDTNNWAYKSAVNKTADTTEIWDGGDPEPDLLGGNPTHGDLTVRRPFDLGRDWDALKYYNSQVGVNVHTITIWPLQPGTFAQLPRGIQYTGMLTGVNDPEVDAGTTNEAPVLELTFKVATRIVL